MERMDIYAGDGCTPWSDADEKCVRNTSVDIYGKTTNERAKLVRSCQQIFCPYLRSKILNLIYNSRKKDLVLFLLKVLLAAGAQANIFNQELANFPIHVAARG